MSAEKKLVLLLQGHNGAKVFPIVAPEGETPPFIVYQFIGDDVIRSHEEVVMDRELVQVSVWSRKISEMDTISQSITDALDGNRTDFKLAVRTGKFDAADPDSNLYRRVLDFMIWHQEGV